MNALSYRRCKCESLGKSESKAVNPRKMTRLILATLTASFVLAEDFKTTSGKEYKNPTVTRVESDFLPAGLALSEGFVHTSQTIQPQLK
jgi:hypothetical protein